MWKVYFLSIWGFWGLKRGWLIFIFFRFVFAMICCFSIDTRIFVRIRMNGWEKIILRCMGFFVFFLNLVEISRMGFLRF